MTRSASYAPHLGAALGAGMMLAAALAFNAGARGGDAGLETETGPSGTAGVALPPRIVAEAPAQAPANAAALSVSVIPRPKAAPLVEVASARPRLAVLVDDVGLDVAAVDRLLGLDIPLTLSILPYAQAAGETARRAQASGLDVFVHLPMEPVGVSDPGPYALHSGLTPEALARRLDWAFSRVPGAVGFNNHMGSRLTADRAAMQTVFEALGPEAPALFVDSLTHPRSQAASVAAEYGLESLRRDVFLDHVPDEAAVREQMNRALALAIENGQAIAIAHPRPETLTVLAELQTRAEAAGVELVPVRALAAPVR